MTTKCICCGWPGLTWREIQQSYARMTQAGLAPEEAKRRSPCCRRCTATLLRSVSHVSGVSDTHPAYFKPPNPPSTSSPVQKGRARKYAG
jgi:hypothetical protein